MKTPKIKAYTAIWLSIPVMIVLSWLSSNTPVDFAYHEHYIVFDFFSFTFLFSLILVIIGLVYWLMRNRPMVHWMKLVHVGLTIGILGTFLITLLIKSKLFALGFSTQREIGFFIYMLPSLFIGLQLILLANIFIGLFGRNRS